MAQDGAERPAAQQYKEMPGSIGKAILAAIALVKQAAKTTDGEDDSGLRTFKYASINDVLEACHDAMIQCDLAVKPIEFSYSEDILPDGQIRARFAYKFRLIHAGVSWVDEEDVRHHTLTIPASGIGSGKAQSLALRDYLKGLFRIRTHEPEEAPEASRETSRETSAANGERHPDRQGKKGSSRIGMNLALVFGPNGAQFYTIEDADKQFMRLVAFASKANRKEWEEDEANASALRDLFNLSPTTWKKWRKALDA